MKTDFSFVKEYKKLELIKEKRRNINYELEEAKEEYKKFKQEREQEEYIINLLKQKQFEKLILMYPIAEGEIKKIKQDIEEYDGYSITHHVKDFFSTILPENKKIKNFIRIYLGNATIKNSTLCYNICWRYIKK